MKGTNVKQLAESQQRLTKRLSALYGDMRLTVMGRGDPRARVLLLGAAPTKASVAAGTPFAGEEGRYLAELLGRCSLKEENVYTTYVCKFRPCRINARGTLSTRPPNREELALFLPFLREEIALIAPRLIVTWGSTAYTVLTECAGTLADRHGTPIPLGDSVLFPLFHPSSIRFNPALSRLYEQDLRRLKKVIQEYVSVK